MSQASSTDAAFFRSPNAWGSFRTAVLTGNGVASCQLPNERTLIRAMFPSDCDVSATDPSVEGNTEIKTQDDSSHLGTGDWASTSSSSRVTIKANHSGGGHLEQEAVVSLAEKEEEDHGRGGGDGLGCAEAGTTGAAADVPHEGTLESKHKKSCTTCGADIAYSAQLTAAAQAEHLAARKRISRLESLASLARQGLAAHWEAFFRDEIERTRMAAAAADMAADRWANHQRQAAEMFWGPWRSKEWKPAGSIGGRGAGASAGAGVQPDGALAEDGDVARCAGVELAAGASKADELLESVDGKAPVGDVVARKIAEATMTTMTSEVEPQRQYSGQLGSKESEEENEKRREAMPEGTSGRGTAIITGATAHDGEGANAPKNADDFGDNVPQGTTEGKEKGHEARDTICPENTIGKVPAITTGLASQDIEAAKMPNDTDDVSDVTLQGTKNVEAGTPDDGPAQEVPRSTGSKASACRLGDGNGSGGDGENTGVGVLAVRRVGSLKHGDQQDHSSALEPFDSAPAANQMVVFVGKAMAYHLSTVQERHMEHFDDANRRRCSSFSMPPQQERTGQRWGNSIS